MNTILCNADISANMSNTPEGYLLCKGVPLAHTGLMSYTAQDLPQMEPNSRGLLLVNKAPEMLFAQETMQSFENKPVTIEHPDFVTPETWKKEAVGMAVNIRQGEGELANNLLADLLITDSDAIGIIRSGKLREISLGYEGKYEQIEPGLIEQMSMIGNHIALVKKGRAGPQCRIYDRLADVVKQNRAYERRQDQMMKDAFKTMLSRAIDNLPPEPTPGETTQQVQAQQSKPVNATTAQGSAQGAPAAAAPTPTQPAAGVVNIAAQNDAPENGQPDPNQSAPAPGSEGNLGQQILNRVNELTQAVTVLVAQLEKVGALANQLDTGENQSSTDACKTKDSASGVRMVSILPDD